MMKSGFFRLSESAVVTLTGGDAARVLNNLFTNEVASLEAGESAEGFVTNVRGWTVAFGLALRTETGILFVGQHTNAASVADHIDRYIIREDAIVADETASFAVLVTDSIGQAREVLSSVLQPSGLTSIPATICGDGSGLMVCPVDALDEVTGAFAKAGSTEMSSNEFETARIQAMWPFQAAEIGEKTIPQEMDRDDSAISFTKGCYLGQETIARLDARGQLQKKLCRVEMPVLPDASEFVKDGKVVGQLTSVAKQTDGKSIGLAVLRRGNFASGTKLECGEVEATVV